MAKEIPLTKGLVAIVDDVDFVWLSQWNWCVSEKSAGYYAVRRAKGSMIYMHRLIIAAPLGLLVDHRDHDTLNNTKSNLRLATRQQNVQNQFPLNRGHSIYKGVCWRPRRQKWSSQISVNNRSKHIGYFSTAEEAAKAYDNAALQYYGEFAYINFRD